MVTQTATTSAWQVNANDFPKQSNLHDKSQFMLRYAVLASSFYNSQPWQFEISDDTDEINIYADYSRWLQSADPNKRQLNISLGCALENLLITIDYFGLGHRNVAYYPETGNDEWAVRITLGTAGETVVPRPKNLFTAINHRDTFIKGFKDKSLTSKDLQNTISFIGDHIYVDYDMGDRVELDIIKEQAQINDLVRFVYDSDVILFSNGEFRKELGELQAGGQYYHPWLSEELKLLSTDSDIGSTIAKKESEIFEHAPFFGVLCASGTDATSAIKVGQVFERLALEATLHGMGVYPVFQLLEIPEMKLSLEEMNPYLQGEPHVVFAMGYVDHPQPTELTPRIPLEQLMHHS